MNSLIEQAAQRLEQLRQAGAEMPEVPQTAKPFVAIHASATDVPPSALSRRIEIDLQALALAGIVSPNAPRSQIADQFRVIKRPLISNAMGKGPSMIANGNLIMITRN